MINKLLIIGTLLFSSMSYAERLNNQQVVEEMKLFNSKFELCVELSGLTEDIFKHHYKHGNIKELRNRFNKDKQNNVETINNAILYFYNTIEKFPTDISEENKKETMKWYKNSMFKTCVIEIKNFVE